MYSVIDLRPALEARFPDVDWPDIDSEFWSGPTRLLKFLPERSLAMLLDALQAKGIATAGQLAPRMDDAIRKLRDTTGPDKKRAEAQSRSRGCPHCGGEGLAIVRPREDGASYTAVCICEMGRWFKATQEQSESKGKGTADRMRGFLDLADFPAQIREMSRAVADGEGADRHFGGLSREHRENWLAWTAERLPRMAEAARDWSTGRWARKRFEIAAAMACYRAEVLFEDPWEGLDDLPESGGIGRRVEDAPIRGSPLTGEQLMAAARRKEELNRQFREFQAKRDGPGVPGRDDGKGGIE